MLIFLTSRRKHMSGFMLSYSFYVIEIKDLDKIICHRKLRRTKHNQSNRSTTIGLSSHKASEMAGLISLTKISESCGCSHVSGKISGKSIQPSLQNSADEKREKNKRKERKNTIITIRSSV